MINGAHVVIFSKDAESDRAFFRDVLGLDHVDAGGGWLIFTLPPAEVAMHPGDENDRHSLYLTCEDIHGFIDDLAEKGVTASPPVEEPWGLLTQVPLPGGGAVGVYQPTHPKP